MMATNQKKQAPQDVTAYLAPQLIHNYDRETGRGPLHIADKHGLRDKHRRDITRCGRVMSPDYRGFRSNETLENFLLCKRCGTADEFAQAVAAAAEHSKRRAEQDRLRREKEDAERNAIWAEKVRRVQALAALLVEAGLRVGVENGTATIEHDGYEFTLNGKGPIEA